MSRHYWLDWLGSTKNLGCVKYRPPQSEFGGHTLSGGDGQPPSSSSQQIPQTIRGGDVSSVVPHQPDKKPQHGGLSKGGLSTGVTTNWPGAKQSSAANVLGIWYKYIPKTKENDTRK
ncbi:MAG: hypothetical protein J7647_15365 [Cyanobacteria bacterium SBLK]|nr:hypothetical protein [Cyanobacteria bacterium SBLK]